MKITEILKQAQNIGFVLIAFFFFFSLISISGKGFSEFGNFVHNNVWAIGVVLIILTIIIVIPIREKKKEKNFPKV